MRKTASRYFAVGMVVGSGCALLGAPVVLAEDAETPVVADADPVKLAQRLLGRWEARVIEGEAVEEGTRVELRFLERGKGTVVAVVDGHRQEAGFAYKVADAKTLSVVMNDAPEAEPVVFLVGFDAQALVLTERSGKAVSRLVRIKADAAG